MKYHHHRLLCSDKNRCYVVNHENMCLNFIRGIFRQERVHKVVFDGRRLVLSSKRQVPVAGVSKRFSTRE